MAASSIVPSRSGSRSARGPRALAARAAARSAPHGPGLATVVALPVVGSSSAVVAPRPTHVVADRPALRVVPLAPRRPRRAARLVAGAIAVVLVLGAATGLVRGATIASADPVVAGHVVLQPGETLWDIAVRSAPAGVDPRRQLDTLRRINGFGAGAALDAWTVVLIPAA
jgi:hypothetical protein